MGTLIEKSVQEIFGYVLSFLHCDEYSLRCAWCFHNHEKFKLILKYRPLSYICTSEQALYWVQLAAGFFSRSNSIGSIELYRSTSSVWVCWLYACTVSSRYEFVFHFKSSEYYLKIFCLFHFGSGSFAFELTSNNQIKMRFGSLSIRVAP